MTALELSRLRVDGLAAPLGLGAAAPTFSWAIEGPGGDVRQTAYRIRVEAAGDPVWDSGRVESSRSAHVRYGGPSLRSRSRYDWQVEVWTDGSDVATTGASCWETGLFAEECAAHWITWVEPDDVTEPPFLASYPSPYLRTELELPAAPTRARVYATALGLYELRINGEPVGDQLLTPGWTDYHTRVLVQTFDVTAHLQPGPNAIGVVLADGWFAGHVGMFGRWQYGDHPAFLAQIEVECENGETVTLVSDELWRGSIGPLLRADVIDGVHDDRRLRHAGWDLPGFDDGDWAPAQRRAGTGAVLTPAAGAQVEVIAELEPIAVDRRDGVTIVDFGQNISGRVLLAPPAAGGTVIVRHGEMLDEDGALYTENLRGAQQRDEYVVEPGDTEPLVPPFTYHGFRYAEVRGIEGLDAGSARAQVLSSAVEQTGSFTCSDPLLNRLHENIVWGQRGNFVSIPTDCPQRDERLGWTGDALCFVGTASFNYDTLPFFRKWLVDLDDAQLPSGAYPDIAPTVHWSGAGNAGWAEAGVLVPWTLYVRYGDERVLSDRYEGMKRFMHFLEQDSTGHIRDGGRYGDWVCLGPHTPKELIGTAYCAATADAMCRIATVLGENDDAARFAHLTAAIGAAFATAFVADDGTVASGTQTAYLLALHHDLVPAGLRGDAAARLAADIERTGHLTTGFLGTPIALPVLTRFGHHELACRLAQRDEYPSWGFSIKHGATTIWERWDGWTADHGFKEPRMNSFNHYALGAVGDWLYRDVAGLEPDERGPGYAHVRIEPRPGGTLTSAAVTYDSVRGRFECGWRLDGDRFVLEATVPPNATADVRLPFGGPEHAVGSGRHTFEVRR